MSQQEIKELIREWEQEQHERSAFSGQSFVTNTEREDYYEQEMIDLNDDLPW